MSPPTNNVYYNSVTKCPIFNLRQRGYIASSGVKNKVASVSDILKCVTLSISMHVDALNISNNKIKSI